MATITSTGIGSNLDIESIISKLMIVEGQKLASLQSKEASYQAKLSGFGTLKGALAQFQSSAQGLSSLSKYQGVKSSSADTAVASVSAASGAKPGTYSLEVKQLAQAQKLVAAGQASDIAVIGSGVITFDFGTISGNVEGQQPVFDSETGKYSNAAFNSSGAGVKTITIDSSNNSLAGIRDAINAANIGVTATIVNDGNAEKPYRLALTVQDPGKDKSLKISVADAEGSTGLSSLLSHNPAGAQALAQTAAAQNSEFVIDGIAISKGSNTVADVLSGITLNLLKTNSGTPTKISVSRDTSSVTSAINSFVTAYNSINATLNSAMAYNAKTKTASLLTGDSSVRAIQSQIRGVLSKAVTGGGSGFTVLSQVGVSFQKDGTLAVDNTKLQKALADNFEDFAGLFAAAGKVTDSLITYDGSTSKTQPGSYAVNVTRLATQGSVLASSAAGLTITAGENDTLDIKLDGNTATIKLNAGTYTAADLATEIQSQINGAAKFADAGSTVKVTESGGVLAITSERYGSASNVSVTGGNGQENLKLGLSATATEGLDVAGTINGKVASGSGQALIGASGDPSEGIKIRITGGSTGLRGTVNYSQGYASQFDTLLASVLNSEGAIAARTDGLEATIERLREDQDRMSDRLKIIETRYRAQFTALDTLISKMNTTSSFLTQQIKYLSSLGGASN